MTTAPKPQQSQQIPPQRNPAAVLPNGTAVNVTSLSTPQRIAESRVTSAGYVEYSVEGVKDSTGALRWFRAWNVTALKSVSTGGAAEAARPSAVKEHVITTDAEVSATERAAKKTPGGLLQEFEEQRGRVWKDNPPRISDLAYEEQAGYKKFAQILTDPPALDDEGIKIRCKIVCNQEYMAKPHDLVPVTLEVRDDKVLDRIAVLEPGKGTNGNVCVFEVAYTYQQLTKLLGLQPPTGTTGAALRSWVVERVPQLGVKAEWLTAQTPKGTNAPNHYSGGIKGKGGSGKVKLRPLTEQELLAAESARLSDWNAGERLRDDRAVFRTFHDVLQPGEEMATGIEAEAEYDVGKEAHDRAVKAMEALLGDASTRSQLNILALKAQPTKITTDTYYDTRSRALLSRGIGLRRRHCEGDAEGTFLFSVKGRSVAFGAERFRLSAQTQLKVDPVHSTRVAALCADTSTDNAFGRIVHDALTTSSASTRWGTGEDWLLEVALTVQSTRIKYSIELANGTTVEFSADTATATAGSASHTLYCVEIGVGHPGLVVGDSASGTSGSGSSLPYTRPYHVPADLDNSALLHKSDFQQFKALRATLVPYLFGRKEDELTLGGNKAVQLARALGLLH
ncbi:hypothetical protein ABT127_30605 [Streptomyces sp. NPDC001904]|uniref:hypothetical protein n=1 Tax=Streptomyces sp. NPDC001904 TaxID=3154531 RepID=UPI00331F67BC